MRDRREVDKRIQKTRVKNEGKRTEQHNSCMESYLACYVRSQIGHLLVCDVHEIIVACDAKSHIHKTGVSCASS